MDTTKLKELRKQRRISIGRMAQTLGVHRDTISRLENGDERASVGNLLNYVKALGDVEIKLQLK